MDKAILIGGVLDGEIIEQAGLANDQILAFEVTFQNEDGEVGTMVVHYRVGVVHGMEKTWYLGRLDGIGFDESITHILHCYHLTSARREFNDRFASHEREPDTDTEV